MDEGFPLSAYCGQRFLGSIEERGRHDFIASDAAGNVIGAFATMLEAADAISSKAPK
jgi:hypothetical protein